MKRRRDPVERAADESVDLHDVSTWEPRSVVDVLAYGLYRGISYGLGAAVLAATLIITLSLLVTPAVVVAQQPLVSIFFLVSIVPAGLLAAYIWYADITTQEPLSLLLGTFLLAILFATFAAVLNSIGGSFLQTTTFLGSLIFFYVVVGPVEETVKLLAVRVFAFRSDSFDAVIDGAVYGAVAGLGFAAIENAIYISRFIIDVGPQAGLFVAATDIAATRALAGPGHVIYSAIAGYYLGLAKFNPQFAGPLIVKGLLVAAFAHGTYNVTVQIVPGYIAQTYPVGSDVAFVGFILVFNGIVGYYLYRKIAGYRNAYRTVRDDTGTSPKPERTEFDPPNRS